MDRIVGPKKSAYMTHPAREQAIRSRLITCQKGRALEATPHFQKGSNAGALPSGIKWWGEIRSLEGRMNLSRFFKRFHESYSAFIRILFYFQIKSKENTIKKSAQVDRVVGKDWKVGGPPPSYLWCTFHIFDNIYMRESGSGSFFLVCPTPLDNKEKNKSTMSKRVNRWRWE